jgi:hypothetical protein
LHRDDSASQFEIYSVLINRLLTEDQRSRFAMIAAESITATTEKNDATPA